MAITATISKPFGRCDDVRALRSRFRRITLTGTYVTGGFAVSAADVGLTRIFTVRGAGLAPASDQATANEWSYEINADQDSVNFVLYENAAAGSPSAEKTNGEAPITGQVLNVEFIGI